MTTHHRQKAKKFHDFHEAHAINLPFRSELASHCFVIFVFLLLGILQKTKKKSQLQHREHPRIKFGLLAKVQAARHQGLDLQYSKPPESSD